MNKEIEGNELEIKEAQDQLNKSEKTINDLNKAIVEERNQTGRQLEQEIARLESVLFIQLIFRSLN